MDLERRIISLVVVRADGAQDISKATRMAIEVCVGQMTSEKKP
jgi:hypothetical protein